MNRTLTAVSGARWHVERAVEGLREEYGRLAAAVDDGDRERILNILAQLVPALGEAQRVERSLCAKHVVSRHDKAENQKDKALAAAEEAAAEEAQQKLNEAMERFTAGAGPA